MLQWAQRVIGTHPEASGATKGALCGAVRLNKWTLLPMRTLRVIGAASYGADGSALQYTGRAPTPLRKPLPFPAEMTPSRPRQPRRTAVSGGPSLGVPTLTLHTSHFVSVTARHSTAR